MMDADRGIKAIQVIDRRDRLHRFRRSRQLKLTPLAFAPLQDTAVIQPFVPTHSAIQNGRFDIRRIVHHGHAQCHPAAHAVSPQVYVLGIGAPQRPFRILTLLANDGDQIEHIHSQTTAKIIRSFVRRREVAHIGMDHKITRFRQRIGVTLRIGQCFILGRWNIAMEHNHHREFAALMGHIHKANDSEAITGISDQVARELLGSLHRLHNL